MNSETQNEYKPKIMAQISNFHYNFVDKRFQYLKVKLLSKEEEIDDRK